MNREMAKRLGLRQFGKQYPASVLRFHEGELVDTFDRLYEVRNGSFRFVEWTDMGHTAAIVRDTKHLSKHYPVKHPAVISEKGLAMRPAAV